MRKQIVFTLAVFIILQATRVNAQAQATPKNAEMACIYGEPEISHEKYGRFSREVVFTVIISGSGDCSNRDLYTPYISFDKLEKAEPRETYTYNGQTFFKFEFTQEEIENYSTFEAFSKAVGAEPITRTYTIFD